LYCFLTTLLRAVTCRVTILSVFRMALCYEVHVTVKHVDFDSQSEGSGFKPWIPQCLPEGIFKQDAVSRLCVAIFSLSLSLSVLSHNSVVCGILLCCDHWCSSWSQTSWPRVSRLLNLRASLAPGLACLSSDFCDFVYWDYFSSALQRNTFPHTSHQTSTDDNPRRQTLLYIVSAPLLAILSTVTKIDALFCNVPPKNLASYHRRDIKQNPECDSPPKTRAALKCQLYSFYRAGSMCLILGNHGFPDALSGGVCGTSAFPVSCYGHISAELQTRWNDYI